MVDAALYSSAKTGGSDEWRTSGDLYRRLHDEFDFQHDAAASIDNALVSSFWTKEDNALKQDWFSKKSVWCNPPYSQVASFVEKARSELDRALEMQLKWTCVLLLPSRTDTRWFHNHLYRGQNEIIRGIELRFLRGRLKFSGAANSAPFPSLVVVLRSCGGY